LSQASAAAFSSKSATSTWRLDLGVESIDSDKQQATISILPDLSAGKLSDDHNYSSNADFEWVWTTTDISRDHHVKADDPVEAEMAPIPFSCWISSSSSGPKFWSSAVRPS
jgi:hypothetical protein